MLAACSNTVVRLLQFGSAIPTYGAKRFKHLNRFGTQRRAASFPATLVDSTQVLPHSAEAADRVARRDDRFRCIAASGDAPHVDIRLQCGQSDWQVP